MHIAYEIHAVNANADTYFKYIPELLLLDRKLASMLITAVPFPSSLIRCCKSWTW